jgi:hypothetical protein
MRGRDGTRRAGKRLLVGLAAACALAAALASPAAAGSYTVSGTCGGAWTAWDYGNAGNIAIYASCPTLVARKVGGAFATGAGVGGGWRFEAPSGTAISTFQVWGSLMGLNGWQAGGFYEGGGLNGGAWESCPGSNCPGGSKGIGGTPYSAANATAIYTRTRCGATACANSGSLDGYFNLDGINVTINDYTAPAVSLAGGSLLAGGWLNGARTLVVGASDGAGIKYTQALIDYAARATSATHGCNWGLRAPCENRGDTLTVSTTGVSDGIHKLTAQAVDAGDNAAMSATTTIGIDNTPPAAPMDLKLTGASGWRSANSFDLTWTDPAQTGVAPIAEADYTVCPTVAAGASQAVRDAAQRLCVSGSGIAKLDGLAVPGPGQWTVRLWLKDAAGNQSAANAASLSGVDFDGTPPTVAFLAQSDDDPLLVKVSASDATSGVAGGVISLRRDGDDAWHALPTALTQSGLEARIDDEALPPGSYRLRAEVTDRAGLKTTVDAATTARLRFTSGITAKLRSRRQRAGTTATITGFLGNGAVPMADRELEVYDRLEGASAWTRVGSVTTAADGTFRYRSPNGPSRTLRLRYPGSATYGPATAELATVVTAATTIHARSGTLRGRRAVTFRGRLAGGAIPSGGVLVELQAFERGRWRTFASPRAATGGAWSYRYRFSTVRGHRSFRFRARIRRQPGYPFETGGSRQVRVTV